MTEFIIKSMGSLLVFILISGVMGSLIWPLFKEFVRVVVTLLGLF